MTISTTTCWVLTGCLALAAAPLGAAQERAVSAAVAIERARLQRAPTTYDLALDPRLSTPGLSRLQIRLQPIATLGELRQRGWRGPAGTPTPNAVYSNRSTSTDKYLPQGPAAGTASRMQMDDLTFTTVSGAAGVTALSFSLFNPSPATVNARLFLRFWNADGPPLGAGLANAPGSYYTDPVTSDPVGFSTQGPFPVPSGLFVVTLSAGGDVFFNLPSPGTFTIWAGLGFGNDLGGATLSQLSTLGQMLFEPIDVGSSSDTVFLTNAAGTFFNVPNPAGFGFGVGAPLANLGWELVTTAPPSVDSE